MVVIFLIALGLIFGSFINALIWRLYIKEESNGQKQTNHLYKKLSLLSGRSVCPKCLGQLSAKDLIPVISWVFLRGKCRYCRKPISIQYPLVEIITTVLFIFSFYFWPYHLRGEGLFRFITFLVILVGFIAISVYDIKWYKIPNKLIYPLIIIASIQVIVDSLIYGGGVNVLLGSVSSAFIIGGLYYLLFLYSKGKWIGGGDVKLGACIGLIIASPGVSLLLLFLSSFSGLIISLPFLLMKKINISSKLPFGPFLIFGSLICVLFGRSIIHYING